MSRPDRVERNPHGALLLVALLAACGATRSPAELREKYAQRSHDPVVVAAVWPWQARQEIRYRQGLQLALEQVNTEGGINGRRVQLRFEDDSGSVDHGLLIAQKLVADPSVVAVIGHLQSYITIPAAALYDMGGLVLISPTSTSPALTAQGYKRVFRAVFSDEDTGHRIAELASQRGCRRMAIYYVRNPYGRALANAFEERAVERGIEVVARASHDPELVNARQSFAETLQQWAHFDLDGIFVAGQVPAAGQLIAAIRDAGIAVPIFGGDAMSSPALISAGGRAVEGTIVATSFHQDEPRPDVQRFVQVFRRRFGMDPDPGSALGYDAMHLLVAAMRRAQSVTPDAVARALHDGTIEAGVTGPLTFDQQGNRRDARIVTLVVRNRQFEYLADSYAPVAAGDRHE